MKPLVALSTCWCSHRHGDGHEMLKEMAALGFEWVELSHGIRITLVPGILRAVEEGVVKVASCHNFCPLPTGINRAAPNLYMPSARDGREREQWLRQTKRTLDFAQQVKARRVVLHLGSVEFLWFSPAARIERYLQAHPGLKTDGDPAFRKLLGRGLAKLRNRMPEYWANTKAGLAELLPYAEQKEICLGVENREGFEELPLDADHPGLLGELNRPGTVGYWHDTGHAHIKESMGVLRHREHLAENAAHLVGFHLHDVSVDGRDHQAIGTGKIDFEMVSEFWRPEHALVIEPAPRLTVDEVLASKRMVEALVAKRFP